MKKKFWLISLTVIALAAASLFLIPDRSRLPSREATERLLQQLGVPWRYPGPPVIVIFGPGCGDCQLLQELLDAEHIPYELIDVVHTPKAREILQQISRNRLGWPVEPFTPTTIVGTRVIRGPHIDKILAALQAQAQDNW